MPSHRDTRIHIAADTAYFDARRAGLTGAEALERAYDAVEAESRSDQTRRITQHLRAHAGAPAGGHYYRQTVAGFIERAAEAGEL